MCKLDSNVEIEHPTPHPLPPHSPLLRRLLPLYQGLALRQVGAQLLGETRLAGLCALGFAFFVVAHGEPLRINIGGDSIMPT